MVFLILFVVPALVGLGLYLVGTKITAKEFGVMLAVQAVVAGASVSIIYYKSVADVEAWNGRVVAKKQERVPCAHSYCCRTVTYTYKCGKSTCTGTRCGGYCNHHPYDVDWAVYTSLNERIKIARIDWQGVGQPPRWSAVVVGEPTSTSHHYENYVKAAPDTLFRKSAAQTEKPNLPTYPGRFYDYYRLDHFYPIGVDVVDAAHWNNDLAQVNAELGSRKQVNVLLVPVLDKPREWFYSLERAWIGGKKNDVIVVASLNRDHSYQWVEVMSWTKNPLVGIVIRDELMAQGTLDRTAAVPAIRKAVDDHFVRREMKDFEYLKSSISPTVSEWLVSLFIGLFVAVLMAFLMHRHDLFNEE